MIQAVQYDGTNIKEIMEFMKCSLEVIPDWQNLKIPAFFIPTLEGKMLATKGDWVIEGITGEFYPCKPNIFDATYEECGI